MIILVYILIFLFINGFAYGLFLDLDIIAKLKNLKLKNLGKFSLLFVKNKNIIKTKNYIGFLSYILQIIHLIFTILVFFIVLINLFLKIKIIFNICNIVLLLYFLFIIILTIKNFKNSIDCRQILIDKLVKEEEQKYTEIERKKIIDKFTSKD